MAAFFSVNYREGDNKIVGALFLKLAVIKVRAIKRLIRAVIYLGKE
jgi:hypothetical protein